MELATTTQDVHQTENKNQVDYGYVTSQEVNQVLNGLFKTKFEWQMTRKILKIKKEWMKKLTAIQEEFKPVLEEYLEKGPTGDYVVPNKFKAGKTIQDFKKIEDAFMEKKTTLDIEKLKIKHLIHQNVRFSPDEVEILDPILDGVEDT